MIVESEVTVKIEMPDGRRYAITARGVSVAVNYPYLDHDQALDMAAFPQMLQNEASATINFDRVSRVAAA